MAPKAGLCSGALPWMAYAHTVSCTRMLTAHVVRQATLHSFLVRERVLRTQDYILSARVSAGNHAL